MFKDNIPNEAVLNRLVWQPEHTHPQVKQKLIDYRNLLAEVENEYSKHLIRINTEEDDERVFVNFCDAVENTV